MRNRSFQQHRPEAAVGLVLANLNHQKDNPHYHADIGRYPNDLAEVDLLHSRSQIDWKA